MKTMANLTREHILTAIKDLDRGLDHSFGQPRRYILFFEGRRYPPKAVLGRALFHATGVTPRPHDFSGGEATNIALRRLGFDVREVSTDDDFAEGKTG